MGIGFIDWKDYSVMTFLCPCCKKKSIWLRFYEDKVVNCSSQEINPAFLSVCNECFNNEKYIQLLESFSVSKWNTIFMKKYVDYKRLADNHIRAEREECLVDEPDEFDDFDLVKAVNNDQHYYSKVNGFG